MAQRPSALASLLASTLLVACGDPAPDDGPAPEPTTTAFRDGSRLVARRIVYPGAEPLLIGIHDRQTGRDCRFVEGADGVWRCRTNPAVDDGVTGRLVRATTRGRLTIEQIASDDGGLFPVSGKDADRIIDTRWDAPCEVGAVEAGEATCLPPAAFVALFHADSRCATPLAYAARGARPALVLASGAPRALGAPWDGPVFAATSEADCAPIEAPEGLTIYAVGERLPDDALAKVRVFATGTGRVKRYLVADEERTLTRAAAGGLDTLEGGVLFFDADANAACVPLRVDDRDIRCVHGVQSVQLELDGAFADAACSEPALIHPGGTEGQPIVVLERSAAASPLPRARGLHTLGRSLGHAYFHKRDGACVAALERRTMHALGPARPWGESFAKLEERLGAAP